MKLYNNEPHKKSFESQSGDNFIRLTEEKLLTSRVWKLDKGVFFLGRWDMVKTTLCAHSGSDYYN